MEALAKVGDFALLPPEAVVVEFEGVWIDGTCSLHNGPGRPEGPMIGLPQVSRHLDERQTTDPISLLKPRQYLALRLSMTGIPISKIATQMELTVEGVRQLLANEKVKEARLHLMDTVAETELAGLLTGALDAYRDGLNSYDIDTRIKAADRVMKGLGKDARKTQDEPSTATKDLTAVLTKIDSIRANNVQINIGGRYGED